jgi:hypothetical protein
MQFSNYFGYDVVSDAVPEDFVFPECRKKLFRRNLEFPRATYAACRDASATEQAETKHAALGDRDRGNRRGGDATFSNSHFPLLTGAVLNRHLQAAATIIYGITISYRNPIERTSAIPCTAEPSGERDI